MTLTDYLIECSRNTDITVTDLSEVLLGLGIGMIVNAVNETPEQELDYEQEECKTREEILHEIFGADDYDYDNYDDSEGDDEDEEFSMTL